MKRPVFEWNEDGACFLNGKFFGRAEKRPSGFDYRGFDHENAPLEYRYDTLADARRAVEESGREWLNGIRFRLSPPYMMTDRLYMNRPLTPDELTGEQQ